MRSANRDAVEKSFVTNSMCFFVGWTWNIMVRDIFMPFGVGVEAALVYLEGALGFTLPHGTGEQVALLTYPLIS